MPNTCKVLQYIFITVKGKYLSFRELSKMFNYLWLYALKLETKQNSDSASILIFDFHSASQCSLALCRRGKRNLVCLINNVDQFITCHSCKLPVLWLESVHGYVLCFKFTLLLINIMTWCGPSTRTIYTLQKHCVLNFPFISFWMSSFCLVAPY